MKYISICSGIEAASAAWHGLGWTPLAFSEIEPFPSAVLAHHYPNVPNLGDMSKYREWPEKLLAECELLVGGTPCQAFSVAGLRRSLDDERGNLSLIYVHLFHHINAIRRKHGRSPAIALWENVPGVCSTKDNAFGCFISGLLGVDDTVETQDGKWPKAGFLGSETVRVGYRILDAQYFGVAQRRRRVFLVAVPCELIASLGERACPSEILSLRESVLGNPPSRGEARKTVAGDAAAGASVGGGCGEPFHLDRAMFNQGVNAQYEPQITNDGVAASMVARGPAAVGTVFPCVDANIDAKWGSNQWVDGGYAVLGEASCEPISKSLSAGKQHRLNAEMESFVVEPQASPAVAFKPSHFTRGKDGRPDQITPPLSADADKGDQDTVVLGPSVGFNWQNGGGYGNANDGLGITEEGTGPLQRCNTPAVAFVKATNPHSNEEAPRFEEASVAACLNGWDERHNPPKHIVAFKESQSGCRTGDVHATIDANKGIRRQEGIIGPAVAFNAYQRTEGEATWPIGASDGRKVEVGVRQAMQVRRLTPTECCRLQGFPDDRCDITFRKKPAADGPKYRALGNSMAVPCMLWLGYRIHKATK